MSACAARRFGSGTPCTKTKTETETGLTKELEDRIQKMRQERESQDSLWKPQQQQPQQQQQQPSQQSHMPPTTSIPVPIRKTVGTRGF